jgi:hypothetical protein
LHLFGVKIIMPRFFLYKINKKYIIFSLTHQNLKILLMNFNASGRVKELFFGKSSQLF